jgi:hypothetical protein
MQPKPMADLVGPFTPSDRLNIDFLKSPEAVAVIKAKGLTPG